jgi:hypothetical protein
MFKDLVVSNIELIIKFVDSHKILAKINFRPLALEGL